MLTETKGVSHQLQYHVGRFGLSYGEAGFPLIFFANGQPHNLPISAHQVTDFMIAFTGTDNILSVQEMGSFFRNQTFPKNWYRRAKAAGGAVVSEYINDIYVVHPGVLPGANNPQGIYVPDNVTVSPFPIHLLLLQ
jgi:hypothetical protein